MKLRFFVAVLLASPCLVPNTRAGTPHPLESTIDPLFGIDTVVKEVERPLRRRLEGIWREYPVLRQEENGVFFAGDDDFTCNHPTKAGRTVPVLALVVSAESKPEIGLLREELRVLACSRIRAILTIRTMGALPPEELRERMRRLAMGRIEAPFPAGALFREIRLRTMAGSTGADQSDLRISSFREENGSPIHDVVLDGEYLLRVSDDPVSAERFVRKFTVDPQKSGNVMALSQMIGIDLRRYHPDAPPTVLFTLDQDWNFLTPREFHDRFEGHVIGGVVRSMLLPPIDAMLDYLPPVKGL